MFEYVFGYEHSISGEWLKITVDADDYHQAESKAYDEVFAVLEGELEFESSTDPLHPTYEGFALSPVMDWEV